MLPQLSIAAAYTYLDVEITDSTLRDQGKSPVRIPEHMASVWLDYRPLAGLLQGFSLNAGARYVGRRYDDPLNTTSTGGYTLLDAGMSYEAGAWQYLLHCVNLTDKRYFQSRAYRYYSVGYERTVNATVKYRW